MVFDTGSAHIILPAAECKSEVSNRPGSPVANCLVEIFFGRRETTSLFFVFFFGIG